MAYLEKATGHQTYQTESSLLDPDKWKVNTNSQWKLKTTPTDCPLNSVTYALTCTLMHAHSHTQ